MDYFDDLNIITVSRCVTTRNGTPGKANSYALGIMLRGPAIFRTEQEDKLLQTPFLYWSALHEKGCWATPKGKIRENLWVAGTGERFQRIVNSFRKAYPDSCTKFLKDPTTLLEVFNRLHRCWERKNDMEKYMIPVLMEEFVAAAGRACEQEIVSRKMSSIVLKCVKEIAANPGKNYSLAESAANAGLSQDYFRHTFRQYSGCSFHDYILKQRYALAVRLLRETNKNIGEISELCGFSSQSLFTQFFNRRSGTSPREFRKKSD